MLLLLSMMLLLSHAVAVAAAVSSAALSADFPVAPNALALLAFIGFHCAPAKQMLMHEQLEELLCRIKRQQRYPLLCHTAVDFIERAAWLFVCSSAKRDGATGSRMVGASIDEGSKNTSNFIFAAIEDHVTIRMGALPLAHGNCSTHTTSPHTVPFGYCRATLTLPTSFIYA